MLFTFRTLVEILNLVDCTGVVRSSQDVLYAAVGEVRHGVQMQQKKRCDLFQDFGMEIK